eukprot:16380721-Heterocapsa_arctica.AAC.1
MKTEDQCHECKGKAKSVYIDAHPTRLRPVTTQDGDFGHRMIRVSTKTDRSKGLARAQSGSESPSCGACKKRKKGLISSLTIN